MTRKLPREELYGLTSQMRRSAVSIPANIAEGHQRPTRAYCHFLRIALGSLAELETHCEVAGRLDLLSPTEVHGIVASTATVRRLLHGLRRSLRRRLAIDPGASPAE
ncbi:hypothetical protein D3C83_67490 [compost metagenome]